MTTVLLADDHEVVRQGLRALLAGTDDLVVVGEADDGLEVAEAVVRHGPDVLVVDLGMKGLGGLEVIRQVRSRRAETRILVLSVQTDESYVLESLRRGASGYIVKTAKAEEILRAIREVAEGRRYLAAPYSDRAVEAYARLLEARPGETPAPLDPYETLSDREREVLQLAAHGMTNVQIGKRLFISPRTVEVHRAHIMKKLGLGNQADLIRYALRRGLVPLEG